MTFIEFVKVTVKVFNQVVFTAFNVNEIYCETCHFLVTEKMPIGIKYVISSSPPPS
jgi:hypothetical protein